MTSSADAKSNAPARPSDLDLLAAILDSATDHAIVTLDTANRVTSWNKGAESILGWSESEMLGHTAARIFEPQDIAAGVVEAELAKARAEGRAEDERWHMRKDGSRFWASGVLMLLRGGALGYVKILRDMTRRHQAEAALRESEQRFRQLAENIPQLVFRSSADGTRIWGSPQWTVYSGLSLVESIGEGWLDAVHPDDRDRTLQAWQQAGSHGVYAIEHRIKAVANGQYRWHKTRATPIRDEHDRIVEWLGTSTDVHDLKQLQQHQEVLLAELQHRARNILAVVRAIANRTLRNSRTLEEFAQEFSGRLIALSRVQGAIAREGERVDLKELIEAELEAHLGDNREQVSLRGPRILLPAAQIQVLALAIHELATNAVKHGALRVPTAHIDVEWHSDNDRTLAVNWRESGVSLPTEAPARKGYGRTLIEYALAYQLGAETRFEFTATGVHCMIQVPLAPAAGGAQ